MPSSAAILHESLTLITYITTVKPLLLTDARALYASLGLTSHRITFDMITSHHEGQVQATLVYYPDLDLDMRFQVLRDGKRCANIGDAVDDLWASIRGDIGNMRAGVGAAAGGDGPASPPPPLRAASGSGASGATGAGKVGSGTGNHPLPHSLAAANDDEKDDKDEKSEKDREETKDEAADEDMEALPGTETENNHDSSSNSSSYSPTLPTPLAHGSSASDDLSVRGGGPAPPPSPAAGTVRLPMMDGQDGDRTVGDLEFLRRVGVERVREAVRQWQRELRGE